MNGKWIDTFLGIIPRNDYTVQLSAGEETGLVVTLKSETTSVTVFFGAVQAFQMLDEGVLLQGNDTAHFAAIRAENFPSTIYEIENGDFSRFIEGQMGHDLYSTLNFRQYTIVTLNYVISIITQWEPEITVLTDGP